MTWVLSCRGMGKSGDSTCASLFSGLAICSLAVLRLPFGAVSAGPPIFRELHLSLSPLRSLPCLNYLPFSEASFFSPHPINSLSLSLR